MGVHSFKRIDMLTGAASIQKFRGGGFRRVWVCMRGSNPQRFSSYTLRISLSSGIIWVRCLLAIVRVRRYSVRCRATTNLTPTYRTYLRYDPRPTAANKVFVLPRRPASSPLERYLNMIMKILTNQVAPRRSTRVRVLLVVPVLYTGAQNGGNNKLNLPREGERERERSPGRLASEPRPSVYPSVCELRIC